MGRRRHDWDSASVQRRLGATVRDGCWPQHSRAARVPYCTTRSSERGQREQSNADLLPGATRQSVWLNRALDYTSWSVGAASYLASNQLQYGGLPRQRG